MAELKFESDIQVVGTWWREHAGDVRQDVRGLWFGLFEEVDEFGDTRFTVYVAGTTGFDQDDDGDWASDPIWLPNDRYLRLHGLTAFESVDWSAVLDYTVGVVKAVEPWETAPASVRGVGVGFDDGEVRIVWAGQA